MSKNDRVRCLKCNHEPAIRGQLCCGCYQRGTRKLSRRAESLLIRLADAEDGRDEKKYGRWTEPLTKREEPTARGLLGRELIIFHVDERWSGLKRKRVPGSIAYAGLSDAGRIYVASLPIERRERLRRKTQVPMDDIRDLARRLARAVVDGRDPLNQARALLDALGEEASG